MRASPSQSFSLRTLCHRQEKSEVYIYLDVKRYSLCQRQRTTTTCTHRSDHRFYVQIMGVKSWQRKIYATIRKDRLDEKGVMKSSDEKEKGYVGHIWLN